MHEDDFHKSLVLPTDDDHQKSIVEEVSKLDLCSKDMFPSLEAISTEENVMTRKPSKDQSKVKPSWVQALPKTTVAAVSSSSSSATSGRRASNSSQTASGRLQPSSAISQVIQLPSKYQRILEQQQQFGSKAPAPSLADTCAQVARSSGTQIEASRSAQTKDITFVIKGQPSLVARARRELWARLAEKITEHIQIPEEYVGNVIGPGGKTIQSIMREFFVQIETPKKEQRGRDLADFIITGDVEGVNLARERIESILYERTSKLTLPLTVEKHLLPFVLGAVSSSPSDLTEAISRMSEKHQVKIIQLRQESIYQQEHHLTTLSISGDREPVNSLIQHLSALYQKLQARVKQVSTVVAKPLHHLLIGPRARVLHQIERETCTVLHIPPAEDPSDSIRIWGDEGALLKGLSAILSRTSNMDTLRLELIQVAESTELSREYINRRLIRNIREIEEANEVTIAIVEDAGSLYLRIDGTKEGVAVAAKAAEEAIVRPMGKFHFDRILVEPQYFKHIIGKQGKNIQHFQTDFGVDVVIHEDEEDRGKDYVLLASTSKAQLEEARRQLTLLLTELSELKSVEWKVEAKFQKAIIGHQGANIKAMHEKYPTVMILFRSTEAGGVFTLKGNQREVDALLVDLKGQLEKIRHDLIMHSYQEEFKHSDLANLVKGKGQLLARWVDNLAQENDVVISLVGSDRIAIKGLKKSVDLTKKLMLERLAVLANTVTEAISIDPHYHHLLIGAGGKNVKHLQRKYSVRVTFPSAADGAGLDRVTLSGPKEGVAAAKEELLELLQYWTDRSYKEQIRIPSKAIPVLVGKGGARIDELRTLHDVDIEIDERSGEAKGGISNREVLVTVAGPKEKAQAVIGQIEEIVKAVQASITMTVPVSPDSMAKLKGPASQAYRAWYREHVREREAATNSQLTVRDGKGFKMEGVAEITLNGPEGLVKKAIAALENLLAALPSWTTAVVRVPVQYHRDVIGQHGDNIRSICTAHSVNIEIGRRNSTNTDDDDPESICISGRQEDVKAAEAKILASVRDRRVLPIESRDLKRAIMREAVKLLRTTPVRHQEVHEGIVLIGPSAALEEALAILRGHMNTAYGNTLEISVPREKHRMIVGAGGKNIQAIREQTGCLVSLCAEDTVQVRGATLASVASAIDQIHALLK